MVGRTLSRDFNQKRIAHCAVSFNSLVDGCRTVLARTHAQLERRVMPKKRNVDSGTQAKTAAKREIEVLSHAYTKAVEWGYLDSHPFRGELGQAGKNRARDKLRTGRSWNALPCSRGDIRAVCWRSRRTVASNFSMEAPRRPASAKDV